MNGGRAVDVRPDEHLSRIIESVDDAILVVDLETHITHWNRAAEHIFGYSPDEVLGQQASVLAPPERQHEAITAVDRILRGEALVRYDTIHLARDGRVIEVLVSMAPLKDARREIVGVSMVLRDVTAHHELARQLVDREAQFRSVVDQSIAGIFIIAETGEVLYLNAGFAEIFGYGPHDYVGRSFLEFIEPSQHHAMQARLRAVLDGDRSPTEARLRTRAGAWRDVLSHATRVRYDGRRAVIGVVVDITDRKEAERALERANFLLRTISAGNAVLVRSRSEHELLNGMCSAIVNAGPYVAATIALATSAGALHVAAAAGKHTHAIQSLETVWIAEGVGGPAEAFQCGSPQVYAEGSLGSLTMAWGPGLGSRPRGVIFLPLKSEAISFGTLGVYVDEPNRFEVEEVTLLRELADDLAYGIAIQRRRLEHEAFTERLEGSMEATVEALAATAEMRDPYTAGHQQHVAGLAAAIARDLGLDESRVQAIHFASIVHDIGKIKIPAELLSKPGRLTPVELQLMQTHVDAGYEILRNVDFPWPIADIVRLHHERLDGSGYPRGLKGADISLEGRILAVADVVEAMSTHRPYRPARGVEYALQQVEAGRGVTYDAGVVDACVRLFREKRFSFPPGHSPMNLTNSM